MLVLSWVSVGSAQDNTSYPLVLSASNLDAMVQGRLLTSPVKPEKQNTIENVVVSYTPTKANAPVELFVDAQYNNGKVEVLVDDELLAKIKGQPVSFEVTQRPVTEVVLKYDAPASDPIMGGSGEGVLFVRLSDSKRMAGKMAGLTEFTLKTAIGEITVPMNEVAGVKLHTTSDDKAVVVLNNGDTITGVPNIAGVELETDWGKAEIDPDFIQSITSTSGAKFRQQSTNFGTRWNLDTGKSLAPGALRN
jgi:hypothetical protein